MGSKPTAAATPVSSFFLQPLSVGFLIFFMVVEESFFSLLDGQLPKKRLAIASFFVSVFKLSSFDHEIRNPPP